MRRRRGGVRATVFLLAFLGLLVTAGVAAARPGGGQSYSGGGGDSGWGGGGSSSWGDSSGDSGDGEGLLLLLELCFTHPVIGIPILVVVLYLMYLKHGAAKPLVWDSGDFHAWTPPPGPNAAAPPEERRLAGLREHDPDFSSVLFDDFVFSLFARAHRARHSVAELGGLMPYLSVEARSSLAGLSNGPEWPVTAVVIGSTTVKRVRRTVEESFGAPPSDWVRIGFEANLVQEAGEARRGTLYVREDWVFRRAAGATTKPWKGARSFECPNCAAPASRYDESKCAFCGETVDGGRFDWTVHSIERTFSDARPPSLTGTVQEVGTDAPTVYDAGAQRDWAALLGADPALTPEAFGARLQLIYTELNRGWNADQIGVIRPLVSDGLCAYLEYWLAAYRAQSLRNLLEGAVLTNWTIARVTRDQHFDAVTVRLWAHGLDHTVTVPDHRIVGGDPTRPRAYSEYWTLIRGAAVRGAPRADRGCPNCGAELAAGMGGACTHCNVVITRGDFDWVLSKIEQDESYTG